MFTIRQPLRDPALLPVPPLRANAMLKAMMTIVAMKRTMMMTMTMIRTTTQTWMKMEGSTITNTLDNLSQHLHKFAKVVGMLMTIYLTENGRVQAMRVETNPK